MQLTRIEWTDRVWNPTSGCSGPNGHPCPYCYARAMAKRFGRSFAPTVHPEKLGEPSKLKKPSRIFVDSFGDLFDPAIPFSYIRDVMNVIRDEIRHTYIILTKQAGRMHQFMDMWCDYRWPHMWLGVTAENQAAADERIPLLLQTPAAVRFVSVEPLLGSTNLRGWETYDHGWHNVPGQVIPRIDWVILGAQSGPGATPCQPEWVESIREQCQAAGVALFEKHSLASIVSRPLIQSWPEVQP